METQIEQLWQLASDLQAKNAQELEAHRIGLLGKKGKITELFEAFKQVSAEEKKMWGQKLNALKKLAEEKIETLKSQLQEGTTKTENVLDLTKPAPLVLGSTHPLRKVRQEIVDIFRHIGFSVSEGPEIDDDWHVFSALNFPADHPARDMQDTFFMESLGGKDDLLLRTHTSSVQVRLMESQALPIRALCPGRVFRNEAISTRSHCMFHQIEGLYIDENVSFADMKQTLSYFTTAFFGKSQIRLRPSYFPFTEPSAEMDVYWGLNSEADYRITKGTGWLEIMGCGMVDPNVLEASGIDSKKYTGFAFGMGIERIAMLRYQITDIRQFFENDKRILHQFV
jgi:phenylalanyl-tRNA synthetase alpha chain